MEVDTLLGNRENKSKHRDGDEKLRSLLSSTDFSRNPGNSQNSRGIEFGRGACQIDSMIPMEFRMEFKFCQNGSWNHTEGINSIIQRNGIWFPYYNTNNAQPYPSLSSANTGHGQQPQNLLSHNHHHPQHPPSSLPSPAPTSTLPSSMSSTGFRTIPVDSHGFPVEFQWNSREIPWKFQNDSYGLPVEFEWNSREIPWKFHSNSRMIPSGI